MVSNGEQIDYSSTWTHTLEEDGSVPPPPLPLLLQGATAGTLSELRGSRTPLCPGLLREPLGLRQHRSTRLAFGQTSVLHPARAPKISLVS